MEISLAFGSFLLVLGACALAARQRPPLQSVPVERLEQAGEPGFLRRVAS